MHCGGTWRTVRFDCHHCGCHHRFRQSTPRGTVLRVRAAGGPTPRRCMGSEPKPGSEARTLATEAPSRIRPSVRGGWDPVRGARSRVRSSTSLFAKGYGTPPLPDADGQGPRHVHSSHGPARTSPGPPRLELLSRLLIVRAGQVEGSQSVGTVGKSTAPVSWAL